jgi:predicted nucleotidyltransferase
MAQVGTVTALADAIRRVTVDLQELDRHFALIGGLAVSVRAEPRFTRDIDLAVAVTDDRDAEKLVSELQPSGYRVLAIVEQTGQGRLATVRLEPPPGPARGVVVDLLFASSGIEPEIVAAADPLEVFSGITLPVARTGHLLALKALARDDQRRPQDYVDIRALIEVASREELTLAREAVALIEQRGFARGRKLQQLLEQALNLKND